MRLRRRVRYSLVRFTATLSATAVFALPASARADACQAIGVGTRASDSTRWPAPLDRLLSLPAREASLRDALDRLAVAGHFRLSYAADLLPLDRRLCSAVDRASAGDVLRVLLAGLSLDPVVVGPEQVVLAPRAHAATTTAPVRPPTYRVLDRVLVTGNPATSSARSTGAAAVVSGSQLADRDALTIASIFDGSIPGIWAWNQAPGSFIARYGSLRGASSFAVSYPKIYIDGVQVANPLLLTQLRPETIERIEVVRGPQGGAMYGADAIDGVISIFTRHDGAGADGAHASMRSVVGVAGSEYAPVGVLTQDHALVLRGGGSLRSAGLTLAATHIGDFVPGGDSRQLSLSGDVRAIGRRATVTGFLRLFSATSGATASSLLSGAVASGSATRIDDGARQSIGQYTTGATVTLALPPGSRWTNTATIGADGYRLEDVSLGVLPVTSPTDSALRAATGRADRATARIASTGTFGSAGSTAATVTLAVEQSILRQDRDAEPVVGGTGIVAADPAARWMNSTGASAQSLFEVAGRLRLSSGMRVERYGGYDGGNAVVALPSLGLSYDVIAGPATLRLRSAWGRSVRAPWSPATTRPAAWGGVARYVAGRSLAPESQDGIEAGADLSVGRAFNLSATRFDQRASGLLQAVASRSAGATAQAASGELQNVGEIDNRGWEFQGGWRAGQLSLTGALALVDSRVHRLAEGYTGDLRPGDRMLEVPARTASVIASWVAPRWSTTWSLSRASDWTAYDRLALARSLGASIAAGGTMLGANLRSYWKEYGGVSRLRATFSRELLRGTALVIAGDNLLDQQHGEPDNITIVPGRTISAGFRLRF